MEILRERGDVKIQLFKEKYEQRLKLPEGWGVCVKLKNPPWEGYEYVLEQHIMRNIPNPDNMKGEFNTPSVT